MRSISTIFFKLFASFSSFISSARNAQTFWTPVKWNSLPFSPSLILPAAKLGMRCFILLMKLLSISQRGKYMYISIFFVLLSSFQFLVSSGILHSHVLAAAEGEQVLCSWNVFTDLFFWILHIGACSKCVIQWSLLTPKCCNYILGK